MRNLLILILFVWVSAPAQAAAIVDYVYDGDTVKIIDNGQEIKLRITNIDAPERNQSYGKKSRRALIKLCENAGVSYQVLGTDKYQRALGHVQCNAVDVGQYMVKTGNAWVYAKYSTDFDLQMLENAAREQRLGLWKNKKPMPPWVWRDKHPHY